MISDFTNPRVTYVLPTPDDKSGIQIIEQGSNNQSTDVGKALKTTLFVHCR